MADVDSSGEGSQRHPLRNNGGHHCTPQPQFSSESQHPGSQRNKPSSRIFSDSGSASSINGSSARISVGPSKAKKIMRRMLTRQNSETNRRKIKTDLQRMQRQLEQSHIAAPSSNGASDSDTKQTTTSQLERADKDHILLPRAVVKESAEIVSSLKEANGQLQDTNQQFQKQLSEMESRHKFTKTELRVWKKKHAKMKKANFELVTKMATKARAQLHSRTETAETEVANAQAQLHYHTENTKALQSHTETTMVAVKETKAEVEDWIQKHVETTAEVEDWKEKYAQMGELYDVLVEKVGALADENGKLLANCQQLEEDETKNKEELAAMDGTQEECDILRQSMEEAMQMASRMSENMENFVEDHRETVKKYEQRLASQDNKLDQAALSQQQSEQALDTLKVENEVLRTQFKEAEKYWLKK